MKFFNKQNLIIFLTSLVTFIVLISLYKIGTTEYKAKNLETNESTNSYTIKNYSVIDHYANVLPANKSKFENAQIAKLEETIGDTVLKDSLNKNVKVCVVDDFENEDSQGTKVSMLINKRFDGYIYEYDYRSNNYNNNQFEDCEVLMYSPMVPQENRKSNTLEEVEEFLSTFKGIVIVPSGDYGSTLTRSEWAVYKYLNFDKEFLNRLIIVSQGVKYNGEYNVIASYGKEIDLMVSNNFEYVNNQPQRGSAYASAVVTSVVANLLANDVEVNEIKDMLLVENTVIDSKGYEYNLLHIKSTYDKLLNN